MHQSLKLSKTGHKQLHRYLSVFFICHGRGRLRSITSDKMKKLSLRPHSYSFRVVPTSFLCLLLFRLWCPFTFAIFFSFFVKFYLILYVCV